MFNKQIIDSDAFLDMPLSAQALYFHLNMRADDDGFINNPKKIQRMICCSEDDLKLLIAKRFVIPFESGVCVIKHWLIHNYIRKDTYKETVYTDEKAQLFTKTNKSYTLDRPKEIEQLRNCNESVDEPSRRLDKNRLDKNSIEEISIDKGKTEKKKKETDFDLLINEYTTNEELKTNIYEFIKMRKGIKASLTSTGLKRILSKLDKIASNDSDKIQILDKSIMNSWRGIFELKKEDKQNNGSSKQNTEPTANKEIRGEGEELFKRAIEKYGDKLQDFECEF
jgi:hypothetical protein